MAVAVKVLLEVAVEQHPDSAIVHCRWGDYYVSIKQTHQAINSYEQALKLDPSDKITAEKLLSLK